MKRSLLTLIGVIAVLITVAGAASALSDNLEGETTNGDTPIRSDDGIDPDECDAIHNIDACTEEELIQLGVYPRVQQLAPIESVDVIVAESFPPQYFVEVGYGLPSGCVQRDDYEVTRDGNRIDIAVTILMPAPDVMVACTMIYGYDSYNVPLGIDFQSGESYTVVVNDDRTETFVAQ